MYTEQFVDIGIKLLEPYRGAKLHHRMQCVTCHHTWSATPISKVQNYKKWGKGGCPKCTERIVVEKRDSNRRSSVQELAERGIVVVSDWNGQYVQNKPGESVPVLVTVRNETCGHTFTTSSKNLLTRGVSCPICARVRKNATITANSKQRSAEWQKTATEWKLYKSAVTKLTKQHYRLHSARINPNNLPTGRAGTEGAYHIDHIVPIRYCYNHDVPVEVCADPSNLQMLGWRENVGSRDNLKEFIPPIFEQYIQR